MKKRVTSIVLFFFLSFSVCIGLFAEEPEELPADKQDFEAIMQAPPPSLQLFVQEFQKDFQTSMKEKKNPVDPTTALQETFGQLVPKFSGKFEELRKSLKSSVERFQLDFFWLNLVTFLGKDADIEKIINRWKGKAKVDMACYSSRELMAMQKSQGQPVNIPAPLEKVLQDIAKSENAEWASLAKQIIDPFFRNPVGTPFPPFPEGLKTTDGESLSLDRFKGKILLLDFWATWCGPCVRAMPDVIKAYKDFHGKGFEVLGISLDEDKGKLDEFQKENGMEWPQFFDGKGWRSQVGTRYGINSIPAMYLIGTDGIVLAGPDDMHKEPLSKRIEKLLKTPDGK